MTADRRRAYAAALAGLPEMTPRRLARLLAGREPGEAWDQLRRGGGGDHRHGRMADAARRVDPGEVAERYASAGVEVLVPEDPAYPDRLVADAGAPAVLFARGDPSRLHARPAVAIVGTRSATPYGRQMATELGRDLASAGVVIVSGLARGIDAAAHLGALRGTGDDPGPPVAVVGTGVDVVYPAATAGLWEEVAARGALLSESPLGTPPRPRVFPARNRIIAALADVVVVVECHHRGGSLHTVDAAARRGIPVGAVPGSVKSRASEGTNGLLVDGCTPIRDAADVLTAVSLAAVGRPAPQPLTEARTVVAARRPGRSPSPDRAVAGPAVPAVPSASRAAPPPGSTAERVLRAVEAEPTSFETILLRTGLPIDGAAEACTDLVAAGHLRAGGGWWSRS